MNAMRRGFSLIECMIYLSLLSVLVIMTWNFFYRSYETIASVMQDTTQIMQLSSALDLISRDLSQACADQKSWYKPRMGEIIFKKRDEHIGWRVHNGSLYRKVGNYTGKKWQGASRSLIAQGIKECTVTRMKKRVHVAISSVHNETYSRDVFLRERVL